MHESMRDLLDEETAWERRLEAAEEEARSRLSAAEGLGQERRENILAKARTTARMRLEAAQAQGQKDAVTILQEAKHRLEKLTFTEKDAQVLATRIAQEHGILSPDA